MVIIFVTALFLLTGDSAFGQESQTSVRNGFGSAPLWQYLVVAAVGIVIGGLLGAHVKKSRLKELEEKEKAENSDKE